MAHLKSLVIVLVVGVLIVAGVYYAYGPSAQPAKEDFVSLVDRMKASGVPAIKAEDLAGKTFELESFRGKVVIVNFWASWCVPCVEEVPSLVSLVKKMKGKAVLVAVSGDSDKVEIESFLKSFPDLKGELIHLLWDHDKKIMTDYGVERLPETFIVDKEMKLARKVVGGVSWDHPESVKYFESLADGTNTSK